MGEELPRANGDLTEPKVTAAAEFLSYQCQDGKNQVEIKADLVEYSAVKLGFTIVAKVEIPSI